MAGPFLWLRRELGPAVKGAQAVTVDQLWSLLVPRNSPVAGQDTLPYWQGFRVRMEQSMGCV